MSALLLCTLMVAVGAEAKVELVAHRGESADAPENTLAAFKLAWERKVSAIELDVHLSRDGQLVVIHDADTERTAGTKKLIKTHTWDELRGLDVGRWKDERFAGEALCLLGPALATIPEGCRCLIEVKVGPEAVPALVEAVNDSRKSPEQLAVISFNAETVAETKRRLPQHQVYFLTSFKQDKATGEFTPTVEQLVEQAKQLGVDGVDVSFKGPIDEAFVRHVKQAGLELHVWTVDDAQEARRLQRLGVDGITTNKAAWLREALRTP